jgi:hypothetical protein
MGVGVIRAFYSFLWLSFRSIQLAEPKGFFTQNIKIWQDNTKICRTAKTEALRFLSSDTKKLSSDRIFAFRVNAPLPRLFEGAVLGRDERGLGVRDEQLEQPAQPGVNVIITIFGDFDRFLF